MAAALLLGSTRTYTFQPVLLPLGCNHGNPEPQSLSWAGLSHLALRYSLVIFRADTMRATPIFGVGLGNAFILPVGPLESRRHPQARKGW
ncbi:hypothetical protein BKA56DRAFT_19302 [Ilyonectria sp. MPI-CAGE-AT-0026]|nr:hypothetical protein BKA56DRAFT_19302 [Ilyonectria sp. MPI-CAGE-AT-0026]